jgi:hypothetical protein
MGADSQFLHTVSEKIFVARFSGSLSRKSRYDSRLSSIDIKYPLLNLCYSSSGVDLCKFLHVHPEQHCPGVSGPTYVISVIDSL